MTRPFTLRNVWVLPLALLWALAWTGEAAAQAPSSFGNEWINYSQPYYKIQVAQNGIYRLSHDYLTQAGISGVDPRKFQLFRRGKEVAIWVAGEADGAFDPTDFIEFYGERNDGKLDVELYKDPAHQIHGYFSFYTDTAAYFLTYGAENGRRMQSEASSPGGLAPEPFHRQRLVRVWADVFTHGYRITDSKAPWMDMGEGFLSENFVSTFNVTVGGITNVEPSGFKPTVEVAVVGTYQGQHSLDILVVPPSGAARLLENVNYQDYQSRKLRFELEFSDISTIGELRLRFTPKNTRDWNAVSYATVDFPQKSNLGNKPLSVWTDPQKTAPSFFLFENAPANAMAYDVTDPASVSRVQGVEVNGKKGFVAPASNGTGRNIFIGDGSSLVPVYPAKKVSFRPIKPADHNYLIVTHPKLRAPSGPYNNPPQNYAAYRASAVGGGYDTLVVEVGQLYDQFHYGEKSATAIQHFMRYMMAGGSPQYLLLLGKGLEIIYRGGFFRRNPYTATEQDLVPPSGIPASDLMYSAYWEKGSFTPMVATGRVAAFTSKDVASYLDKVKEHEALPNNLEWRKNMLHLGGGQTEQEISQFRFYLNSYKAKAVAPFLGGQVSSIFRSNVRDIVTNLNVSKEVNNGLSLITFFGHSSPTISDIDIGNATNTINGYRNKGKYPMILMNGCSSGNAFTRYSFGEDWIVAPEKGAILFLAHSNLGFPNLLNLYSSSFYETAFNDQRHYGKPVGQIQLEVINKVNLTATSFYGQNMVACMLLQGDPAVALFSPAKPDYEITDQALSLQSLDGKQVTSSSNSFALAVDVKNLGQATLDSFYVSVKRTLPNNEVVLVDSLLFPPVFYRDTLLISLEAVGGPAVGVNRFEVFVDHPNIIEELNEDNNIATLEYFFSLSGLEALYPQEYSIVSNRAVELKGHALDFKAEEVDFYFELDTIPSFRHPLQSRVVKGNMLPTWEVTLPENKPERDSAVYYWRFRLSQVEPGADTVWAQSSFRYIQGSPQGWSQSHRGQFSKAVLKDIRLEQASGRWDFGTLRKTVEIRAIGGNAAFSYPPYGIFIDGSAYFNNTCGYGKPNMMVVVLHPHTLERYTQMPANTGTVCGTDPKSFYQFADLSVAANRDKLEAFLRAVPEGYKVALVGMNQVPFSDFSASLKEAFRGVGSQLISSLASGHPFALVGTKGAAPGKAEEMTFNAEDPTAPASQAIHLVAELEGRVAQGTITSSRIGPAASWGTLLHQVLRTGADTYRLKVVGVNQEGQERVLVEDVREASYSLQGIDASLYPYLQLELTLTDPTDRTPPQLKQWVVTYTGLPEGVIRPDLIGKSRYERSGQLSGNTLSFPFVFQNVSDQDFKEALTAEVTLYKADGTQSVQNVPLRPLAARDTLQFVYSFPANGVTGENRLRVFVNPRLLPELSYANNIFEFAFNVTDDELHPVLDVVFDGIHIMNGDIVSPSPVISLALKDENKVRFIEDPNLLEIFLKRPGQTDYDVINVATHAADIQYTPGTEKEPLRLQYNPKKLADGTYELRVQGKDVAGNLSGKEMYQIEFEVVNESTISRFYPYPNPFSSNTRFIFTLTGSSVPERMKIQILTVTGKVVREITQEEIGPIRIGNNTTQFAWDGTDEFGDKLANGVYLYRVVMDRGPEEFKHRRTAGDKAFKHDYGKLYILR